MHRAAADGLRQEHESEVNTMTLYRIYWIDKTGYRCFTYIEVPDSFGRKKAAEARRIFMEQYDDGATVITRTVKDC